MSDIVGTPIGEWNHVYLIFGLRGFGKSTYCVEEAMRIGYPAGAYVIGHSLGARFPRALPDGENVPVEFYSSIDKLNRGLKRNPAKIHILASGEADDVIRYARELSRSIRRKAWRREKGWFRQWNDMSNMNGIVAPPILVILDESVALSMNLGKTSHRNEDSRYFREALYSARHEHIGYMFQIQDPNALGPAVMSQGTNYVCFRLEHQWAINALNAAGAPDEMLDEIPHLELGEYVEFGHGSSRMGDEANRGGDEANRGSKPDSRTDERSPGTASESSISAKRY